MQIHRKRAIEQKKSNHYPCSWSSWWSPAYLGDGGVTAQCDLTKRCSFTSDRASLDNSSLVMFSYTDLLVTDMPPKYLLGQQWALFLPRPSPRHAPDSDWARYLPMFDVLISYFPQSNIPMFRARVISYNEAGIKSAGQHNDSISPLDQNYDVKFRNEIRKIRPNCPKARYCDLYL